MRGRKEREIERGEKRMRENGGDTGRTMNTKG